MKWKILLTIINAKSYLFLGLFKINCLTPSDSSTKTNGSVDFWTSLLLVAAIDTWIERTVNAFDVCSGDKWQSDITINQTLRSITLSAEWMQLLMNRDIYPIIVWQLIRKLIENKKYKSNNWDNPRDNLNQSNQRNDYWSRSVRCRQNTEPNNWICLIRWNIGCDSFSRLLRYVWLLLATRLH